MTTIDLGGGVEPMTAGDIKIWARIDRDDEDGLIANLIRAGRETIEATTGLVLARRMFRLVLDPVPGDGWAEVRLSPIVGVTSITAYGADGTPIVFDASEAIVERVLGIEAIRLSPAVRMAAANGVEVEFEAGFSVGTVPENLLLALRTIVAASYELRAAVDLDQQPAVLPPLARSLLAPYRRVRI